MNSNCYCVILAGGIGSRLWPISRNNHPKQFLDVLGVGMSLLQSTYERYRKFIPQENIIVVSNESYKDIVREQLPLLPEENLLLEPIRRNTVPSVTWAAIHLYTVNPDAFCCCKSCLSNCSYGFDGLSNNRTGWFAFVCGVSWKKKQGKCR